MGIPASESTHESRRIARVRSRRLAVAVRRVRPGLPVPECIGRDAAEMESGRFALAARRNRCRRAGGHHRQRDQRGSAWKHGAVRSAAAVLGPDRVGAAGARAGLVVVGEPPSTGAGPRSDALARRGRPAGCRARPRHGAPGGAARIVHVHGGPDDRNRVLHGSGHHVLALDGRAVGPAARRRGRRRAVGLCRPAQTRVGRSGSPRGRAARAMSDPTTTPPAVMIEELRMIVPRFGEGPAYRVIRNWDEIVESRRRLETARGWLIGAAALAAGLAIPFTELARAPLFSGLVLLIGWLLNRALNERWAAQHASSLQAVDPHDRALEAWRDARALEQSVAWVGLLTVAGALAAVFMAWQGFRADPLVHPLVAIAVIAWMLVDGLPKLARHVRVRRERRGVIQ